MARTNWDHEQTLIALAIYCRTPFGKLHARNPEIIEVASALGRTPSALAMKCCNIASYDPAQQERGISGLSKTSRMDRQVWDEFQADPETIAFQAEQSLASLTNRDLEMSDSLEWEDVRGLDQERMTKVRVNQNFFRTMILAGYRSSCAVCEMPLTSLLVAAHIIPWSIDRSKRMNPHNGICLCVLHDKAFDRGLLVFDEDLRIDVSLQVRSASQSDAVNRSFLSFVGRRLALPDRWHPDPIFIRQHNEMHSASG